jgi:competence protein ComEC
MKKSDVVLIVFIYILFSFRGVSSSGSGSLDIDFLDVGQGDAILISTPNGKRVLIDGGDNFETDFEISKRIPFYSCYIDVLVLTHPHYDHIVGLNRLMQRCKIGTVMFNDVDFTSRDFERFKSLSSFFDTKNVYAGESFKLDGVLFKVLWPTKEFLKNNVADINDVSIVMFLDYGDFEALFTGDATDKVLGRVDMSMFEGFVDGGFDVLKVPHHGSKYSLHKSFYSKLKPNTCVISVGKDNKFSHPFPSVIDYFKSIKCNTLRTDEVGDIKMKITWFLHYLDLVNLSLNDADFGFYS